MLEFSEFHFEVIQESPHFILQRGRKINGAGSILLRSLTSRQPFAKHFKWLEHEYALAPQLHADWALVPLELTRHQGWLSLVIEDSGGQPIDLILHDRLEINDFLRIAILAADALGEMHQTGIIHKDIKPSNMFLDAAGKVRFTGFGIASTSPRERQEPAPIQVIAGTFPYMAPEQTGRMNRSIDVRSDLYSLGVTFYEMATGRLPFSAKDPLEWVHCHTALQPVAPSMRGEVPEPLSAIIMKLLSKTADERFQTAKGLVSDLIRCQNQWNSRQRFEVFPLGGNDKPNRLLVPERLYGRGAAVSQLLSAFDRVVRGGTTELILVSGYSGVGKSSVVNELHKVLAPPGGFFASGKFDQHKRDIPFGTLAQAFQKLVRYILATSEFELEQWRGKLKEALGPNGKIITNLIPEVEILIGQPPPVPELPAKDAANRFQIVFRKFISTFASPEHPIALFLDDLQWLDIATLKLLKYLVTTPEVQYVLLVGAYRENEVDSVHPLSRTIKEIRNTGRSVENIVLTPLQEEDVAHLLGDALHYKSKEIGPLTSLLYRKTGGNPFFLIQFLTELAENKLIYMSADSCTWRWDLEQIQAQRFTDNIVNLMVAKLSRLSIDTQITLKQLSCLGNTADLETLALVGECSQSKIEETLSDAVQSGLLLRDDTTYRFVHDRVQEAAYAMMQESERAAFHLKIGRVFTSSLPLEKMGEKLFEIVNHFDRGAVLIESQTEKDAIAALFSDAAKQARTVTAINSALKYSRTGRTLLGDDAWQRQYALTFELELNTAECEFLTGDVEVAEKRIFSLTKMGRTKIDLAAAYKLKASLHLLMSELPSAVETTLKCLRLFDIEMSAHPSPLEVSVAFMDTQNLLSQGQIGGLIDLPLATNPEVGAAMAVLSAFMPTALFTDERLMSLNVCHMVRLTLRYGVTAASPQGFGWYGILLAHLSFVQYQEGYQFGILARELVIKHRFVAYEAQTLYTLHVIGLWTQPISDVIEIIQSVFRSATKASDMMMACYACIHTVLDRLTRGDHLEEVLHESEHSLAFVEKVNYPTISFFVESQQRWILQMLGRTESFETLDVGDFKEESFEKTLTTDTMDTMVFWYWFVKGQARYMAGCFDDAAAAFARAIPLYKTSLAHVQNGNFSFFSALTLMALPLDRVEEFVASKRQTLIQDARDELWRLSSSCPSTFAVKHAILCAELARVDGQSLDAIRLYEESIKLAREYGSIQHEALAHELAARFYLNHGFDISGMNHLRHARGCYESWGAHGKVRHLEKVYPALRQASSLLSGAGITDSVVEHLDILAVVKATQAVSSEIVLEALIRTLLTITVESAGAQRGFLILFKKRDPYIAAEANTTGDQICITLRNDTISPTELPLSVLRYAIRTKESLILDNASQNNEFSNDTYIRKKQSRSLLMQPILKRGTLIGMLYLENNLTSHAFTSARLMLLEMLSLQAAISLENAMLYGELRRSEAFLAEGQRQSATATWTWTPHSGNLQWSAEYFRLFGFVPDEFETNYTVFLENVHPDDRAFLKDTMASAVSESRSFSVEFRGVLKCGEVRHFLLIGREMDRQTGALKEYMGTLIDITERKHASQALLVAQEDFKRASQLIIMGEFAASIAHEINQPITAMVTDAYACLLWLADGKLDVAAARKTAQSIVNEGHRAGEIIKGVYRLAKKHPPELVPFDINHVILDVFVMLRNEIERHEVILQADLCQASTTVFGDSVQIRQVILNILRNAIEAMSSVSGRKRMLHVLSNVDNKDKINVVIQDTGPGLDPSIVDRVFMPFVTTKSEGMGMGLSICQSIIESHGGNLWISQTGISGTIFQFSLPVADASHSLSSVSQSQRDQ